MLIKVGENERRDILASCFCFSSSFLFTELCSYGGLRMEGRSRGRYKNRVEPDNLGEENLKLTCLLVSFNFMKLSLVCTRSAMKI